MRWPLERRSVRRVEHVQVIRRNRGPRRRHLRRVPARGGTLTVWVGRTLHRSGRVFLLDVFDGDEDLSGAVNHLLVVGFYLLNLGYVLLALEVGHSVVSTQGVVEALSVKLGAVSLVLGAVHLANLYVLNKLRRRAVAANRVPARPPVAPDAVWGAPPALQV